MPYIKLNGKYISHWNSFTPSQIPTVIPVQTCGYLLSIFEVLDKTQLTSKQSIHPVLSVDF